MRIIALALLLSACSSDDNAKPDAAVLPDARVVDVAVPDVSVPDVSLPDVAVPDAVMPDAMPLPTLVLHVEVAAVPGGDGSENKPFASPVDAVAAARVAAADDPSRSIVIFLGAGTYTLDETLVLDVPGLGVFGVNEQVLDGQRLPTAALAGDETRLVAAATWDKTLPRYDLTTVAAFLNPSLVTIAAPRVTVEAITFDTASVAGGGVEAIRSDSFAIRRSSFAGTGTAVDTVASTGVIVSNYFDAVTVGAIIAGGNDAEPSGVNFTSNRVVDPMMGGVLLNATGSGLVGVYDSLTAYVTLNDLEGAIGSPNSFGIRMMMTRRDAPDTQASSKLIANIDDNTIAGNTINIIIDAGFPFRVANMTCDDRVFTGTFALEFHGNLVSGATGRPALISTTRGAAALAPATQLASWQYLHGAVFDILDPDDALAGASIEHPATDRYTGTCANDATAEDLGNRITIDGTDVTNQVVVALP